MKSEYTYYTYASPHGTITIGSGSHGITEVVFGKATLEGSFEPSVATNTAASQLMEYLAGKRTFFEVALDPQGSSFQKSVWCEVALIPYGETCSTQDIAANMGKPGSYRSVGTAIRQNQLAPFIPTHRVLMPNATGAQAKLFRGFQALERKTQ